MKYNIITLASKYGVKKVSRFCAMLLSVTYCTAIALPFIMPMAGFKIIPMAVGHTVLLSYFLVSYSRLDASSVTCVKKFYKAIWNLFYLEYCLYPLI